MLNFLTICENIVLYIVYYTYNLHYSDNNKARDITHCQNDDPYPVHIINA